jgi:hypothetical protein
MTTRTEARNDIMALVADALASQTGLPIHWPGIAFTKPEGGQPWVRVTMQHLSRMQAALGKDEEGKRRYVHNGQVVCEVFQAMGDGLQAEDTLAMLLWNAFKAAHTTNGVILRNATAREVGADGGWHRTNVSADFEYYENAA